MKTKLTDRFIRSRKAAPKGSRIDYHDALVPGLALRVTDNGHRSFVLHGRFPSSPGTHTRRALGDYGALTLDEARDKAREWLRLMEKGRDPRIEEARQKAEELRRQAHTFEAVAEAFIERYVKGRSFVALEQLARELRDQAAQEAIEHGEAAAMLSDAEAFKRVCADPKNRKLVARLRLGPKEGEGIAKKDEAQRIVRGEFVKKWRHRPITEILPEECADVIRGIVKRGAPYQAHNALGYLRRLFTWAIGTQEFGLTSSPVDRIKPGALIGERESRRRVLTPLHKPEAGQVENELRAVWNAAAELGYPYGPIFQLLILTGQREREIADGQWEEIDVTNRLWTVPEWRMKGNRIHEIPFGTLAAEIIERLPRFNGGTFLFSTTNGEKPINGFSKAKKRIDKLSGVTDWKIHDLRRTVRTGLSSIRDPLVDDTVREIVIAHWQKGIQKVYDHHSYRDEKRRALELWERRLMEIVTSQPARVAA